MPRSRPGRGRAGAGLHRATGAHPVIDGLSSRALSEINELERTRNYLRPGNVSAALALWKDYAHRPERALWHAYEWGDAHFDCCGDPFEGRALLDTVMRALSPRSARELRKLVSRWDAGWDIPP
ncbi:hypothetical protein ACFVQ0_00285 [Streptomyces sp. NPDC057900]|uniref:hypothetical protein n=1 Tax=Streptomyces sp. NPDC057900 TaxID=3346274 RepID=UPI0036E2F672